MDPKKDTWTSQDKLNWLAQQRPERSYKDKVLNQLDQLSSDGRNIFHVEQYGNLSLQDYDKITLSDVEISAKDYAKRFPLFSVKVGDLENGKPSIIVTGGTHGYEESGVYGALDFLKRDAQEYSKHFNFLVFPCLSPFSYEINQRWTHDAWDPNRSFDRSKPYVPEAQLVMDAVEKASKVLKKPFAATIDLHETPDRDRTMMPPQYARYGITITSEEMQIPAGYYLIAHAQNKEPKMSEAIIQSVSEVTTIAPEKEIDGEANCNGVVTSTLENPTLAGLNMSFMKRFADNSFTTEIYPEIYPAPRGLQEAVAAQRATILGVLKYLK